MPVLIILSQLKGNESVNKQTKLVLCSVVLEDWLLFLSQLHKSFAGLVRFGCFVSIVHLLKCEKH